MRIFLIISLFIICNVGKGYSQETGYFIFTDLSEALKQPDSVLALSLRKQKLTKFPEKVFMFKNLRYLDLSKNSIDSIPAEISQLTSLEELDVSRNKLTEMTAIAGITNLKRLKIFLNEIVAVPQTIGNLKNLEVFDIWGNELGYFPESLRELTSLKELDMRVILISKEEQKRIEEMLPNAKIHFSNTCNCTF